MLFASSRYFFCHTLDSFWDFSKAVDIFRHFSFSCFDKSTILQNFIVDIFHSSIYFSIYPTFFYVFMFLGFVAFFTLSNTSQLSTDFPSSLKFFKLLIYIRQAFLMFSNICQYFLRLFMPFLGFHTRFFFFVWDIFTSIFFINFPCFSTFLNDISNIFPMCFLVYLTFFDISLYLLVFRDIF